MNKAPTKKQRLRWGKIADLGCIIQILTHTQQCQGDTTIHHCGTGGGGRKNHDKVIGLCWRHHIGDLGIDGKRMSKGAWQELYRSEEYLLHKTAKLLGEI